MDGTALELWNKKILLCRYKRTVAFKACLDGSRIKGHFHNPILLSELFQLGAENLDLLVMYWKETFQSSWLRETSQTPASDAEKAQTDVLAFMATEEKQIEGEIFTLGKEQGLSLKIEDLKEGKALMSREASVVRATCMAMITDLKTAREEALLAERRRVTTRFRELWITRSLLGILVAIGSIGGAWFGFSTQTKYAMESRAHLDQKMRILAENQQRMSDELNILHRSNRKIAFWTEKNSSQVDQEMEETRISLKKQMADIREETARKVAMVESEYARSGRDGGVDLDRRKQGLFKLQENQLLEAQERARKHLDALEEQKNNIQR